MVCNESLTMMMYFGFTAAAVDAQLRPTQVLLRSRPLTNRRGRCWPSLLPWPVWMERSRW